MIPLRLKHFEINEVYYPTLDNDSAKFLIAYWYGRTKVIYDEFLISRKKKDFVEYIDYYNIFIRALHASGICSEELVKFIRDLLTSYFDFVLNQEPLNLKKQFLNGRALHFFIMLHSFEALSDLNEKACLIIEKVLSLKKNMDYDLRAWFNVLLGNRDFVMTTISDPLLIGLVLNDFEKYEKSLDSIFDQSKNRALKIAENNVNSDYFLARSTGFFDYSSTILKNGYLNIFYEFNSTK